MTGSDNKSSRRVLICTVVLLSSSTLSCNANSIVDVMVAFHHRPDVQIFGLHNLAKLEYPEDAESGFAHPGGLVALDYVLHVLPAYKANETIQVAVLCLVI